MATLEEGSFGRATFKCSSSIELVDVDGRRYEVVPDAAGDLTLESTITPMAELDRRRGAKPASQEDFDRLFGHLPTDGEG